MQIHHHDPETGRYLGASTAQADPLELERAQDAVFLPMFTAARASYEAAIIDAAGDPAEMASVNAAFEGALVAAREASDAVEPQHWLVPAFATLDTPPNCPEGECPVWTDGRWLPMPDVVEEVEPDAPVDDPADVARRTRDAAILAVRWLIDRHRDEIELGLATTLGADQHRIVLVYIQALRQVPEQPGFPTTIDWPELHEDLLHAVT